MIDYPQISRFFTDPQITQIFCLGSEGLGVLVKSGPAHHGIEGSHPRRDGSECSHWSESAGTRDKG
jgi:hypothetical protein